MDALHRGEDSQFGEAHDVVGVDVLGVLDPPAEVVVGARRVEDGLVDVQDLAVGAVADGVRVDLEAVLDRDVGGAGDVRDGFEHEAFGRGHVLVRLQEPRAVRSEGAVDLAFDGAYGEVVVTLDRHVVLGQASVHFLVGVAAHHDVQADRERALFFQTLEPVNGREARPRVLERGHALGQRFLGGQGDLAAELGVDFFGRAAELRIGEGAGDGAVGGLSQQPREFTVLVAHEFAAGRGLGVAGVAAEFHRQGVREGSVARSVFQQHGVVGTDRGKRGVGRVPFHHRVRRAVPLLLVPPAPADPLARLGLGHRVRDHLHDLVPVGRVGEVEDRLRVAEHHVVAVSLDEPGCGEPAIQFDDLRLRADERVDVLVAADRHDPAVVDRDRFNHCVVPIDSGHDAAAEHQIGAFRRIATGHEEDGEEQRGVPGARCQRLECGREHRAPTPAATHATSRAPPPPAPRSLRRAVPPAAPADARSGTRAWPRSCRRAT